MVFHLTYQDTKAALQTQAVKFCHRNGVVHGLELALDLSEPVGIVSLQERACKVIGPVFCGGPLLDQGQPCCM